MKKIYMHVKIYLSLDLQGGWECVSSFHNQLRVRVAKLNLPWIRFLLFSREGGLCKESDVLYAREDGRLWN